MEKEQKEIIKLTAKEIFKTVFDIPMRVAIAFEGKNYQRSIQEYYSERDSDKHNFRQKIHYLKQQGLIKTFIRNKERFVELTPKGLETLTCNSFAHIQVTRQEIWDGRFRMVIFDIPEKQRAIRDGVRQKLDSIGFKQIQKSVFVYPFECKKEIDAICDWYDVGSDLKYLITDIIEGEEDIIAHFLNNQVLTENDVTRKKESQKDLSNDKM